MTPLPLALTRCLNPYCGAYHARADCPRCGTARGERVPSDSPPYVPDFSFAGIRGASGHATGQP